MAEVVSSWFLTLLSNAAYRVSLRGSGAEIEGGGFSPPAGGGKSRGPAGRGLIIDLYLFKFGQRIMSRTFLEKAAQQCKPLHSHWSQLPIYLMKIQASDLRELRPKLKFTLIWDEIWEKVIPVQVIMVLCNASVLVFYPTCIIKGVIWFDWHNTFAYICAKVLQGHILTLKNNN